MELVTENLEGWVPFTNVYRDGAQYYIISAVDYFTAHHTEIYLAAAECTPVMDWVPNDPAVQTANPGDWHREQVGEHCVFIPVDADGDPLNGLTPLHVLPGGTTHEQAINFLLSPPDPEEP